MPKILILSTHRTEYASLLQEADLPGAVWEPAGGSLAGVEVIVGEPNLIQPVLDQLPDLKWVQSTWAGVEPLLKRGLRRDYILTNARGVFGRLMSEYVIGYLLLHERKMLERWEAQKEHRWNPALTGTLQGKTIGLLGVGSIGAELAHAARFFGMVVRGYTRSSAGCPDIDAYYHGDELLDFARGLDYLVSILPNTPQTDGLISAGLLAQLPSHAVFMNVGRGSALDEAALVDALHSGHLARAVLDVFRDEPLPPAHPFWTTPHLLITSHTSAPSFPKDIARVFAENYRLYLAGKPLNYRVDFEQGY